MAARPAAFEKFDQTYGDKVNNALKGFAKNTTAEQASVLKMKDYQSKVCKVAKGTLMCGLSLDVKETARKCVEKEGYAQKYGYPPSFQGRDVMILAIATFVVSKHLIKKKHDKQVERFLEIEGPFDLEMCISVIKEVVPDLPPIS